MQATTTVHYTGMCLLSRVMRWAEIGTEQPELRFTTFPLRGHCVCAGQNPNQVSVGDTLTSNAH